MRQQITAIVLTVRPSSDRASVAHLYTREGGRLQLIVHGNKWKNILQPMQIVHIGTDLHTTKMSSIDYVELAYLPQQDDIAHYCLRMFMAEALEKVLRHPMTDETLFDALEELTREADETDDPAHFPEHFMTRFSMLLGFGGGEIEELRELKSLEVVQALAL